MTVSLSRRLWRRLTDSRAGCCCCCCRRLSARDWNTRGNVSVPIAPITHHTKQGFFLNHIKIKQMRQIKELDLLWLLLVSPPSAVSQSRPDAASQKCAEISRGDLEDKALSKITITQDAQYYYVPDCLIPEIWALWLACRSVSLGCGHFYQIICAIETSLNPFKRWYHHDWENVAFFIPQTTKNINRETYKTKSNRTGHLLLRELTAVLENTTGSAVLWDDPSSALSCWTVVISSTRSSSQISWAEDRSST